MLDQIIDNADNPEPKFFLHDEMAHWLGKHLRVVTQASMTALPYGNKYSTSDGNRIQDAQYYDISCRIPNSLHLEVSVMLDGKIISQIPATFDFGGTLAGLDYYIAETRKAMSDLQMENAKCQVSIIQMQAEVNDLKNQLNSVSNGNP
jgi:hypothetical protein